MLEQNKKKLFLTSEGVCIRSLKTSAKSTKLRLISAYVTQG